MNKIDVYLRLTLAVDADTPQEAMIDGKLDAQRIVNEINRLDVPEVTLWEVKERKGNYYDISSVEEARELISEIICHEDY